MGDQTTAAAVSGMYDLGGQFVSYGLNARAASKAWDRQKDWATRGPGYMMTGLRNAGLNPILAAQGGFRPGVSSAPMAAPARNPGTGAKNLLVGPQKKLMEKQGNAADAAAGASLSRARRDNVEADSVALQNINRAQEASWAMNNPAEYQRLIGQRRRHEANPNTWAGAVIRAMDAMEEALKGAGKSDRGKYDPDPINELIPY